MMKGVMGQQNSYMTINWGAFDHASHVPQLRSCNYYNIIYSTNMYIHVHATLSGVAGVANSCTGLHADVCIILFTAGDKQPYLEAAYSGCRCGVG